jgi:hypothetical protein
METLRDRAADAPASADNQGIPAGKVEKRRLTRSRLASN